MAISPPGPPDPSGDADQSQATPGSQSERAAYEEMRSRLNVAWMITQTRHKKGWSQEDLAERAGTKQSRISELESVRGNPTFDTLDRVARALGLGITLRPRASGVPSAK